MSRRITTILLIISLSFNLGFLGSIIWIQLHFPHPMRHNSTHNEWVRLPEHIRNDRSDPELRRLRVAYDDQRVNLMRALALPNYEEMDVTAIIDSSLTAQTYLEKELGYRLLDIRKQMSAEEAEEYFGSRADMLETKINRYRNIPNRSNKNEENNDYRLDPGDGHRHPPRPERH
ncbi:MAG: hypothetical protein PHO85_06090 [Candidatus Cloacimonetes bacterium]|nr:hypothetical protein [Candidatus Cloacimonadota bacterium]MDD2506482.1 hypothetical protein [Candidatus Cloacimonadota bacterium]MDD4148069.1 hypothetical protein [Candidatus Cloacimonadota bacterium]MDD4560339.1 hypothetical protein [Candidatus Cloacimonadota bacterium]